MALPSYLSILKVLVLLLALPVASSRKFDHYCETERTVVEVAFDRSTNAHVVVGGRRGGKRLLKHEEDLFGDFLWQTATLICMWLECNTPARFDMRRYIEFDLRS